jgi:hypothetical protein
LASFLEIGLWFARPPRSRPHPQAEAIELVHVDLYTSVDNVGRQVRRERTSTHLLVEKEWQVLKRERNVRAEDAVAALTADFWRGPGGRALLRLLDDATLRVVFANVLNIATLTVTAEAGEQVTPTHVLKDPRELSLELHRGVLEMSLVDAALCEFALLPDSGWVRATRERDTFTRIATHAAALDFSLAIEPEENRAVAYERAYRDVRLMLSELLRTCRDVADAA